MSLIKSLSKLFPQVMRAGAFHKARFLQGRGAVSARVVLAPRSRLKELDPSESILVVGVGIAAITILKELKLAGHQNVQVLAKDQFYGGKCVNFGCMPSEYFAAHRYLSPEQRVKQGRETIGKLRSVTEQSIRDLGYGLVNGRIIEVQGKEAVLDDGRRIRFDRIVLATGNRIDVPAELGEVHSIEKFWELESGELVLITDHNLSTLSYADIALDQGLKVTVVFKSKLVVDHLPSVQYFLKSLARKGARILFEAKEIARDGQVLRMEVNGERTEIKFDHLVFNSMPEMNLPTIDGRRLGVLDVDFQSSTLGGRDDVFVAGDASGLLAATEAEFQAKKIVESWMSKTPIDMRQLERIPFRLHASETLAMVGPPWSYLKKNWRMLDFRALGWSLLHGEGGKLWYLYDASSDKVEAIHVCHREAGEIISIASLLIDVPLSDPRWMTSFVHPSSFEIFKVLVEDVRQQIEPATRLKSETSPVDPSLHLPDPALLDRSDFFRANFTDVERKLAVLDPHPSRYLAVLLGVKEGLRASGVELQSNTHPLCLPKDGKYIVPGDDSFEYSLEGKGFVRVKIKGKTTIVRFDLAKEA